MGFIVNGGFNTVDLEIIMFLFYLLILAFLSYMLYRNHQVFKERERVRKIIFKKGKDGLYVNSDLKTTAMVKEMEKIGSYLKVWLIFWKPVKLFYLNDDIKNWGK